MEFGHLAHAMCLQPLTNHTAGAYYAGPAGHQREMRLVGGRKSVGAEK